MTTLLSSDQLKFWLKSAFLFTIATTLSFGLHAQCDYPCISFQGVLKDANGVPVPDGQQTLKFSMYNQDAGGASLPLGGTKWEETANVDVQGGIFSHNLGSIVPLIPSMFKDGRVFLNINMKDKDLLPRAQLTYAPFAYSVESARTVECSGALGDVKYSILAPEMFRIVNGDCWVPMDGRTLAQDDLLRTKKDDNNTRIYPVDAIPNAGGLFLRAQDFSKDPMADGSPANTWRVKSDSDKDPGRTSTSTIGTEQQDTIVSHTHTAEDDGVHSHKYKDKYYNEKIAGGGGSPGSNGGYDDDNDDPNSDTWTREKTTYSSGSHTHIIKPTGGAETRPANLNLWIYIRIN